MMAILLVSFDGYVGTSTEAILPPETAILTCTGPNRLVETFPVKEPSPKPLDVDFAVVVGAWPEDFAVVVGACATAVVGATEVSGATDGERLAADDDDCAAWCKYAASPSVETAASPRAAVRLPLAA